MAKLQNQYYRSGISTDGKVALDNIDTDDYTLSQVKDYIEESLESVSNVISEDKDKICSVVLSKDVSLTSGEHVPFDKTVYDPFSVFRDGGVFRCPISGPVCFNGMIHVDSGSSGTHIRVFVNNEPYGCIGIFRGSEVAFSFYLLVVANSGDLVKIVVGGNVSLSVSQGPASTSMTMRWS